MRVEITMEMTIKEIDGYLKAMKDGRPGAYEALLVSRALSSVLRKARECHHADHEVAK